MSARDCWGNTAGLPIKQAVSQHGFKTLNVNAEAWLSTMLTQSCLAEAAFLIGGYKAANLLKIQRIDKEARGRDEFRALTLGESLLRA